MTTTYIEKVMEEFRERFTIHNSSSRNGIWWIVPMSGAREELASPVEVEKFIHDSFTNIFNKIIKDNTDSLFKTVDYKGIAEEVIRLSTLKEEV